jgi:hypothetical protein
MFPKVRVFLFAAAASLALSLQTGCSTPRRAVPARKLVAVAEVCATPSNTLQEKPSNVLRNEVVAITPFF